MNRHSWERLQDVLREPNVRELMLEHFEESGVDKDECPLDPDFDRMMALEREGILKLIVSRDGGTLTGYMVWFTQYPLDYRTTLHAIQGPWNRASLLGHSLPGLKAMGVKRVIAHLKTHVAASRGTLAPAFERAGLREVERVFYKVL
jgi:hypothetical protein